MHGKQRACRPRCVHDVRAGGERPESLHALRTDPRGGERAQEGVQCVRCPRERATVGMRCLWRVVGLEPEAEAASLRGRAGACTVGTGEGAVSREGLEGREQRAGATLPSAGRSGVGIVVTRAGERRRREERVPCALSVLHNTLYVSAMGMAPDRERSPKSGAVGRGGRANRDLRSEPQLFSCLRDTRYSSSAASVVVVVAHTSYNVRSAPLTSGGAYFLILFIIGPCGGVYQP